MDKRSWPWKKKSSDKAEAATDTKTASLPNSGDTQTDQEHSNIVKYVQISMESYVQLTELEGQVIDLNRKISNLNGKLLSAQSEITNKDTLVKQHSKVAEEAVSGWEKAEAEALALKNQLESVMLLKLTAEDRASHLDDALKECMKQIRNVKEEGEQKLHDVVVAKSKQWENAKAQLEAKIMDFEQELLRSSTENAALSRSLQERCNLLMKISDEKSQVDAEIEMMKNDIQTCEREISSLKYELHVVSKELEIRNEEKNMSMRSADVANKQHLEDVKKIAKLEAECQRLRGLVRKKLPGPAALAQMKLEVESLGRDYGEIRRRRSPARSSSPHHISAPTEFSLENIQQCHKENEFLTARLLTMEEEMKMLKEALSMRNSELQASTNKCAKTASELHSVEAHVLVMNQKKGPRKTITDIHFENESNPASLTSIAEDGIDEEVSCYESLSTALMSESLHIKKEKNGHKANKADSANHLELMDDFLEMEKLACLSTEANESTIISDGTVDNLKTENVNSTSPPNVQNDVGCNEHGPVLLPLTTLDSTNVDQPTVDFASEENDTPASNLQSRIVCLFEQTGDTDIRKLLEDFRQIIQDAQQELPQHSVDRIVEESNSTNDTCMEKECHEDMGEVSRNSSKPNAEHVIDQELKDAISQILDFVSSIGEGPAECQDRFSHDPGLIEKIEEFSSSVDKVLCNEASLHDFLMVTGDTVLENSNSVVEANTWRASELSEIRTVLSQGKGYIDLLQDADLDIEMQLVGISVDESICANAHKVESSLGKSQIIITDSEVVNNGGMPQASACKRVESIQELEAKKEIQDPKNEVSSLKDEVAVGKQNVKVGKGELLKGTEKQAVKCLDTSIGGIPGMENKQHISYNLIFVDTANFSISDLVWGKVKSHPWWPGQIIDPSDASKLALKYQKKDNFLVAYFGDKTFAWCDDSQLKPFYSYFSQMEKQCSSDTFATAMNDILVEISRRVELGMTCSCFPDESYANIKFQKVDNAGVRKGNVTSFLDRPQVLNYFQPGELLEYIKTLAQFPNGGVDRLELVIAKSQLKAFYCSKGYPELPIFTVHRGLIEDVAEIPLSNVKGSGEGNAEHSTPDVPGLGSGKGKLRSSDNSSKKRKHVLEDDGKQKSTSGLTNEENALHLGDDGKSKCGLEASETLILSSSGMKHTVLGSDCTDSGRHKKRTPDFFGDIETTSPSPTVISSFKIGEFIRRAASHLTGAPPIVKCQQESTPKNALQTDPRKGVVTDFDVLPHAPEENKAPETNLSENNSSPDEMFSQLCLAARDPMNGDSSMSMIVDFFSSFRNSCVSCIREGKKHVEKRKRGRPRKVISQPLFSELFSDISSSEEKPVEKRKRCRPKKYSDTAISDIGSSEEKHVKKCSSENQHVEKRRRGRPKKVIPQPAVSDIGSSEEKHAEKPKRGRPRKVTSQLASSDMSTPDHMKDSYWSDTNLEKRPRKKSLSDLKRKGESHEQTQQKKRKSAGGRPLSLPSVSMLENEQKLQLVAMNTNIKYPFIAERPIISVAEKIVDERMPTALILSFSSSDTLPSPTDLIRIFSRYGPLKEAETDVVIKTNCAKVVFKRRVDAEAAFSSAGKYSIFGPGLLSYQLKSLSLTTKPSQQTTQENHDTTSIVMPQDNLNPTIATLQGDHDQVISVAQNEHDEDLMTTPQDKHDTTASASKPEENHDTASVVIPQGNLNPTIATLQGDHDQVISVVEHDEDPMITPQDNHDTTTSASKPEENHDTASIVIPRENLNPTIANLQGDHDQAISVAPNEHDEELMTTPQDMNDTTMVSRPQNDDSGAITTPDETKDAELIHGCNLETSEVAEGGFALDIILVEAEAKLSPQVKYDAISIPQPEYYNDAASIPTPEKKNDAGLMQGCNLEISEVAEGGIALDTILVEAEAGLPQGKYDATSIPQPKEYHDAAPIAAPQDKLDSTTTSGDYHDAAPITSTEDQYETTQIESSSSLTEDKHDATVTTEHSDYHDAAPIVASPDYHDATPNTASQEYQGATPTTALQENYEATQEQSETVMEVDKIQVETEEESSR